MSNKVWKNVDPLDKLIRQTLNLGMNDKATYLTIEFIWGFELFNTRAYHNYETWSGGYRVSDHRNKLTVEREDLDDALRTWATVVAAEDSDKQFDPKGLARIAYKHRHPQEIANT